MALPIIQHVRRELPNVQVAYTFFSPSAERFARAIGADFTDYLPFDTRRAAERALNALRPTALVFSKLDVWPTLVATAHARGVPIGLTSASMPRESSRTHGIGRRITVDAYGALDAIGSASADDAKTLIASGARKDRVTVTGDTRYDQAWDRAHNSRKFAALVTALTTPSRFTLVAGSTWPADEQHLLPAWTTLRRSAPDARLIIAPHEIREPHLREIELWAQKHQLTVARLGDPTNPTSDLLTADVVLIDRIGVLADLYATATVAYVGGGFHSHGLHSIVEPAVLHVPTIVGPQVSKSRDATLMRNAGALLVVDEADALATQLIKLHTEPAFRHQLQQRLATTVSNELGATLRSFEILRKLLGSM